MPVRAWKSARSYLTSRLSLRQALAFSFLVFFALAAFLSTDPLGSPAIRRQATPTVTPAASSDIETLEPGLPPGESQANSQEMAREELSESTQIILGATALLLIVLGGTLGTIWLNSRRPAPTSEKPPAPPAA